MLFWNKPVKNNHFMGMDPEIWMYLGYREIRFADSYRGKEIIQSRLVHFFRHRTDYSREWKWGQSRGGSGWGKHQMVERFEMWKHRHVSLFPMIYCPSEEFREYSKKFGIVQDKDNFWTKLPETEMEEFKRDQGENK